MLKISDAACLAKSKIRAHKIWFTIVILVEALLLAAVFLLLGISNAVSADLKEYSASSLSGRYLVRATSPRFGNNSSLLNNTEVWDLADKLYKEAIAEKTTLAKQLGVSYDAGAEEKPTEYIEDERTFNTWSEYAQMAISEYINSLNLGSDRTAIAQQLNGYVYKSVYAWHNLIADGSIVMLDGDKENFVDYKTSNSTEDGSTLDGFQVLDESLYADFMGEEIDTASETIPIVISLKTAQKYLDTEDDDYLDIYAKIIGTEYTACYRNNASRQLIFDIEQSQANADFGIVYDNPANACGEVVIKSDQRSEEEKLAAEKEKAFAQALGEYEEAYQEKVTFRVVGVIPTNTDLNSSTDLFGLIKDLGKINIGTPIIPRAYYETNKQRLARYFLDYSELDDLYGVASGFLIEFNDAATAARFVEEQTCENPEKGCLEQARPFSLSFSNKSLLLADISAIAQTLILILASIAVALAVMTTIVIILRSIHAEKKEIAIYKAIGFRRGHLVQIYATQTMIITATTILLAVVLALAIGIIANLALSADLTEELSEIFSIYHRTIATQLFTFDVLPSLGVIGLFLAATTLAGATTTALSANDNIVAGLRYE